MRLALIFAVILFMTSCQSRQTAHSPVVVNPSPVDSPQPIVTPVSGFSPDAEHFQFGLVFKIESLSELDRTDPHHVAGHSVFLCQNGDTERLLRELGPVERDEKLGESFVTFIREFCPDLESFKGMPLYLRFEGYQEGKDTSIWYYYLVKPGGERLKHDPWVSLHRSKYDGKCSITGIFLNEPGTEAVEMPKGLKKALS